MSGAGLLIIDNDNLHAIKLREQLTELGYNILDIINNPREALAAYYASEPDLVIINTSIENNLDGIEIAENKF
jgi:AmiR/NasT family two-component response regulator